MWGRARRTTDTLRLPPKHSPIICAMISSATKTLDPNHARALPSHPLMIAAVFILAGVVKGVTGMGLPTVAMGALGAFMPPVTAASLLIIPSLATNVWQLFAGPSFAALLSRLWLMMLGIVIGTLGKSTLLTSANTRWTTVGLGTPLMAFQALAFWLGRSPSPRRWNAGYRQQQD